MNEVIVLFFGGFKIILSFSNQQKSANETFSSFQSLEFGNSILHSKKIKTAYY